MYSYELHKYFEKKDWHLTWEEYDGMREESSQIYHIKYLKHGDTYSQYLVETTDGYSWILHLKNKVRWVNNVCLTNE